LPARVPSSSGYRVIFRQPAVRWQAGTGLLAQVTQSAAGPGIILVVREHGRSLALAGVIVAALWIAAGLARPVQGRLIDRRGPGGVLASCGIVHGAALIAIVGLSSVHAPGLVLIVLGIVGGLALPPVSTTMRLAWGEAVESPEHTAAYSLVFLVQELAFLAGPLVLAALIGAFSASAALVAVAALAIGGSLAFAISAQLPSPGSAAAEQVHGHVLRIGSMRLLLAVGALTGSVWGGVQVAAPTFATEHHAPAAAGLLIAALSVGGIIGAATYAGGRWRAPPSARLLVLLVALTVVLALISLVGGLVLVGALLLGAGLPLNPSTSTLSLLVDQHVPRDAAGEAFGWLSTGSAAGLGLGSVIAAGVAQQEHTAQAAFIVTAVAAAVAAMIVIAGRRVLEAPGVNLDPPAVRAAAPAPRPESPGRPHQAGGRSRA
jgi:MFS family permease